MSGVGAGWEGKVIGDIKVCNLNGCQQEREGKDYLLRGEWC